MALLVITNKLQITMLDDSLGNARGVAIGSPEKQDVINLVKEFYTKPNREILFSYCPAPTYYEDGHARNNFMTALDSIGLKYWQNQFSSHKFEEGDHILVLHTDSYDPVFSDKDDTVLDQLAFYLISF
jgi:hypothetical protein